MAIELRLQIKNQEESVVTIELVFYFSFVSFRQVLFHCGAFYLLCGSEMDGYNITDSEHIKMRKPTAQALDS